jgi:hypothetical protein
MPSGYTAGIIDGKIKTFREFAVLCVRAFGAAIHMKDDSLSEEYTERVPNDYYQERIKAGREKLVKVFSITDEQIIQTRMDALLTSKEYYTKLLIERTKDKKILEEILEGAKKYKASEQYQGIKTFMIEQLSETLKHDGDTSYVERELEQLERDIDKKVNAEDMRSIMLDEANKDIQYYQERYDEELARCVESNEWVKNFFNSLPNE